MWRVGGEVRGFDVDVLHLKCEDIVVQVVWQYTCTLSLSLSLSLIKKFVRSFVRSFVLSLSLFLGFYGASGRWHDADDFPTVKRKRIPGRVSRCCVKELLSLSLSLGNLSLSPLSLQ